MLTISYYSVVSGSYKTLQLGCDGTTDYGGSYNLRKESTRSTIQKYNSSSSLTESVYKVVTYSYYDCNTPFMTDAEASSFFTEFLTSKDIEVTCSEDDYTNAPATVETSSGSCMTNAKNGVVSYDFVIKISTSVTQW